MSTNQNKTLQKIRIGTRGSPLALTQARMVESLLKQVDVGIETEIVTIKSAADWRPEEGEKRLLAEAGGKGQFAREIETALLMDEIDIGVHSMKDMETALPDGLIIPCMLRREDPRDVLLFHANIGAVGHIQDLPEGAVVGTASVRRQAFLLARRQDLKIVPLRGNVETRIQKLRARQVDATLLALAGLKRLGLAAQADTVLSPEDMLPAAGQGAVGVEVKESNTNVLAILSQINHAETLLCVTAERAALNVLDGSCHTPIGAYACRDQKGGMRLRVALAALDGSAFYTHEHTAPVQSVEEADKLGRDVGGALKEKAPADLLRQSIKE